MSTKYKFRDQEKLYFVRFAEVYWIDLFVHNEYKDIVLDSWQLFYVHHNPATAWFIEKLEKYSYSSAKDYYGGKELIDILLLDPILK